MQLLIIFYLFLGSLAPQHDFHTSISEADYNTKSKHFEIALRVFTDDLELALSREHKLTKGFRLDNQTPQHDTFIKAYLRKQFYLLDARSQKIPPQYVGKEVKGEITWIYFELEAKKTKKMVIKNAVLTEIFDDQVNIVNLNYMGQKKTYILKRGQTQSPLKVG